MTEDVDVVVVGGGPTGLTAALGLAGKGVRVRVLEQRAEPSRLPRARALNGRTMEVLRRLGVAEEIIARTRLPQPGRSIPFTFAETVAAAGVPRDIARERIDRPEYGPVPAVLCPQVVVEEILRDKLPAGVLRGGARVVSVTGTDDGVQALVRDGSGGADVVRARYAVVADGAASGTRHALGIGLTDQHRSVHSVLVHFRADLSPWVGDRPSNIYFLRRDGVRTILQPTAHTAEWVINRIVEPGTAPPPEPTAEDCAAIVRRAVGAEPPDLEILESSRWRMGSSVAERFVSGRLALAGDAAHRVSPFSGSGMNLGVLDADNLSWKLAAMVAGQAGPGLLHSYDQERRPPAVRAAREDRRSLGAAVESGPTWDGWATAVGSRLRKDGLEYGTRYVSDAVHEPEPAGVADTDDSYTEYRPQAAAGHRAPHVVLGAGRDGSVLDLFGDVHVLLTTDPVWATAARDASDACGVPVRPVVLDPAERTWSETYDVRNDGAVLVRPDGYVAWRCVQAGAQSRAGRASTLAEVLTACLALR